MKLLLEFKDYSDLSFIKDTVEDVILSEIEESIKPVIHQSIITISDGEVTCYDLKRSEYGSSNLDFKSYLISLNDRIKEEDFNNISAKIESILSLEFDEKIKCIYEPCIRACVTIKFISTQDNIDSKEVSIFIFKKGNIIITGARSKKQVLEAYNYINNIFIIHKDEIIKKSDEEEEEMIFKLYNDVLKDLD